MNRSPFPLSMYAPAPLNPSSSRDPATTLPGMISPVGWNWTISMSRIRTPTRKSIPRPSTDFSGPGAKNRYWVGPPPVATRTQRAFTSLNIPCLMSSNRVPVISLPEASRRRSTARFSSSTRMFRFMICSVSRLTIPMPVRSPLCTVRSNDWPANGF